MGWGWSFQFMTICIKNKTFWASIKNDKVSNFDLVPKNYQMLPNGTKWCTMVLNGTELRSRVLNDDERGQSLKGINWKNLMGKKYVLDVIMHGAFFLETEVQESKWRVMKSKRYVWCFTFKTYFSSTLDVFLVIFHVIFIL